MNKKGGFYGKKIYSGKLVIYTEEMKIDDDAPTVEIKLTVEEFEQVKEVIQKNIFFSLETDLSDPVVMDGSFYYITVHTKDKTKKVGGEVPIDEDFLKNLGSSKKFNR